MTLIGIFDFYHFDELTVISSTDWFAVVATAILSGIVSWGTVLLTLSMQKVNKLKENAVGSADSRATVIGINHRVNVAMCTFVRSLKKTRRHFVFGSKKAASIHVFNTIDFKYIDELSFENLFRYTNDIGLNKEEKRLMMDYKKAIASVRMDMESFAVNFKGICDDIMAIQKETDNFITSNAQSIQAFIFKYQGLPVQLYPSAVFDGVKVIKNPIISANLKLFREIDNEILRYQQEVRIKSLRVVQYRFYKNLLAIARRYQKYNFLSTDLVQGFQTAISMIDTEKNRYFRGSEYIQSIIRGLNKNREIISKFSRVLSRKHRKKSLKAILNNISIWKSG